MFFSFKGVGVIYLITSTSSGLIELTFPVIGSTTDEKPVFIDSSFRIESVGFKTLGIVLSLFIKDVVVFSITSFIVSVLI